MRYRFDETHSASVRAHANEPITRVQEERQHFS